MFTVDTSLNATFAQAFSGDTFGISKAGADTLELSGASTHTGTLTLSGSNTYTGATIEVQYGNALSGWRTAAHQGPGIEDIPISSAPDGPGFSQVTEALPANLADSGKPSSPGMRGGNVRLRIVTMAVMHVPMYDFPAFGRMLARPLSIP